MNRKPSIDINCDMGESFGRWSMGNDKALFPFITSANIACGYHAGDPLTMLDTVQSALKYNVHIGAHPGFQDLEGFGRRSMHLSPREIYGLVVYQVGALAACAKTLKADLHHVKPHGALYNIAAREPAVADAIVNAIYDIDSNLILYGLSGSELIYSAKRKGLNVYSEVFADRTYQHDGTLTPRTEENSIIKEDKEAINQILHILLKGKVKSVQGQEVDIQADTICIHGDNPNALEFATMITEALKTHEIEIK